jgi:hypothetical protein
LKLHIGMVTLQIVQPAEVFSFLCSLCKGAC